MIKRISIIIGILLILVVAGIWAYLFFSGKTSNTEGIFAEFGDGGNAPGVENDFGDNPTEEVFADTSPQKLRQLTLRPVAGAALTDTGVLYVEQGTGHVYHINLASGNETLVSGTTLPQTRDAVFSNTGLYVAITHYDNGVPKTILGSFSSEGGLEGVSLPDNATNIAFGDLDIEIYYTLKNTDGSRGYLYNIETAVATELFSIPLRDIRVLWGEPIYVYTTPSIEQVGYVYEVKGNSLQYVTGGGAGLTALHTSSGLAVTWVDDSSIRTRMVEDNAPVFATLLPEKCTTSASATICAVPSTINSAVFPDSWYQGEISLSDSLWEIGSIESAARTLSNLFGETGREIDVIQIGADESGEKIWFINKNDNSLWLFDRTIQ